MIMNKHQEKRQLRSEIKAITHQNVDGRTSLDDLRKMLADVQTEELARKERVAAKEAEQAQKKAERLARIERRGPLEEFIKLDKNEYIDKSEQRFANLLWIAKHTIDCFPKKMEEFTTSIAENPEHAMSWSMGFMQATAQFKVAKEMMNFFDRGATPQGWKENCETKVLNYAKWPARSTLVTSNLMEECMMEAWAKALDTAIYSSF